MYYFIHCNEDGDICVVEYMKDELLGDIEEEYWGDGDLSFFDSMPNETDPMYWGDKILLIKGKIVTPQPVKVVDKYDIE